MAWARATSATKVTFGARRGLSGPLLVKAVNERLAEIELDERVEAAGAADLELGWNGPGGGPVGGVDGYGSVARWP
jgi:hypothetical protein